MKLQVALIVAALGVVGCASSGLGPGDSDAPLSPSSAEVIPSLPALPEGLTRADLVSLLEQASAETGVAIDEIRVVTAEAVTWSDGSLGCPEEGQMYTQALVPGYRVILDVAGEELAFHASHTGDFTPCSNPTDPVEDGTVDR